MTSRYRFRTAIAFAVALSIVMVTSGCGQTLAPAQPAGPSPVPTFTPLPAPVDVPDSSYSGGRYTYKVPNNWNGGLVLYAHGYQGEGGPGNLENPPLGAWWLSHGYAWAASSYRSAGYRVDWFVDDMLALRDLVISQIGSPRWTVLYGQSMGGHVVTSSLEQHPGVYQGAVAECGVVDGVSEADYEVAYAAAAEYISGIGLLDLPDTATFQQRVGQWLQVMGMPGSYTDKGRQFDSVVKYLEGGNLPERLQGMMTNRYTVNLGPHPDPVHAPTDMPIRRAADTRQIRYHIDDGLGLTDDELNANVRRVAPAPGARDHDTNPVFADMTGRLSAPLVTIHTTGDAWVPMSLEQSYRRKTISAGTQALLVQRAIRRPAHCDFNNSERQQAFMDLVTWLEQGTRPDGDDLLVADVSTLGKRWTLP